MSNKNPAAVALAKKRSASMTPERRQEIAKKAIKARWDKYRKAQRRKTA